jgi:hypothetical protein
MIDCGEGYGFGIISYEIYIVLWGWFLVYLYLMKERGVDKDEHKL